MTIKDRIKELCKEKGVSMNQVEKELGFGVGYISKLGNTTPSAKYIQKLAEYFNVSSDFILKGKESEFSIEMAEKDIALTNMETKLKDYALKLSQMPKEKQEHIMNLIDMLSE